MSKRHIGLFTPLLLLWLLATASTALAGPPTHLHNAALDIGGFNHACGVAVDSEGDVYVSSAGESKVKVFNPAHTELTSIPNANEPCGLAVNSKGELYVSEKATGKVVRYKPNAYPFAGSPTYGAAEPIDAGGTAKGIAVDPHDDRLYVAEGDHIAVYNSLGTLDTADEVQQLFVVGATGGTFKLSFKGEETGPLPFNAGTAEVKAALTALSTIGAGNVEVQASGPAQLVTFVGALADTDVEALKADSSGLEGGANKEASITEKTKGFSGRIGEGALTAASGVAAYTNAGGDRYVFAADAATDQVKVFGSSDAFGAADVKTLKLRRTIDGPKPGEGFGFGAAGAYLAVDPGNRSADQKCASVAEQACTAGHLLVYDEAHDTVDEFEATGQFLDQFTNAALADAEPTALAIDRSGGPGDGTIYVSAGSGPSSELLAFGPLVAPSRPSLPEPLSRVLDDANAVATDPLGNVYVSAGVFIHVYDPAGKELTAFEDPKNVYDLAVDSTGTVYVIDQQKGKGSEGLATYYTPSAYPPVSGTTYARHEPPIATASDEPDGASPQAIAVNPANDHVFMIAGKKREYDSAANGSALLNNNFAPGPGLGNGASVAVYGANGNVYFAEAGGSSRIFVYNATGTEVLATFNGAGSPEGASHSPRLAIDQSNGHVLAYQSGGGPAREYDASGAFVAQFGSFSNGGPGRIALDNSCALHDPPLTETTTPTCKEFNPANGNVYVALDEATPGTFDLTAFGPLTYGEGPLAITGIANGLGAGSATLNGTVNPNAFDLTECRFEYLTDAEYLTNGETFAGASSQACAESPAEIGKDSAPVAVHADIVGLDPGERYRFRLVARNKFGESEGKAGLFGPPVLTAKSPLPILYDEATLRANVDPSGLQTEYRFEYGKVAGAYDHTTPVGVLNGGAGPKDVQAALVGLEEGMTYHFRVVAENEAGSVEGPDQTLVTLERRSAETCPNTEFRTGLSANLPDCRAYELVTPAETNGLSPFVAGTAGNLGGFNHSLVDPRGPGGGESVAYFTDGTLPGFEGNGVTDGYRAHRGSGAHPPEGWSSEVIGPSYAEAVPGLQLSSTPMGMASDQLYSFWAISPEEDLEGSLPEGRYLHTPAGFEVAGQGSLGTDLKAVSRYVSVAGAHVLFTSKAQLEENAPPGGTEAVYDRATGASSAKVVSLLPGEVTPGAGQHATYVASTEDGTAVAFKVGGALYLRRGDETVQVAEAPNTFAGVSEDGRRVFYTATANGSTPGDLFACDVESGSCAGPEAAQGPTQIAEDSIFVNVSADGSGVLFTTEEAGEDNLYAWDGETEVSSFVAVLDPRDFENKGFGDIPGMNMRAWTTAINPGVGLSGRALSPTRSTPDGEVFVFQSHAQLTAYDNEGHGEIYRYDPAAAPAEQLLCVSCDPSGASPATDAMLQDTNFGSGLSSEALIPNITDDGQRVFFQTADRLLPEDASSVDDVYEWQAKGAGGCNRAAGCLALISSGQGERPSYLYGMSADGHDVFFRTREKLVGQDVPGSPSLYDARIEGGTPHPPAKAPCEGDACQGDGSTPPVIQSPASATIRSAGNTGGGEGTRPRCAKGQRKVRRGGKTRCVKKQRVRRKAKHRADQNRRAQR